MLPEVRESQDLRREPLDTTASSDSGSSDAESCSSASNLSLSVGHFPCEDTFFDEDTAPCEDKPSEGPSTSFLPPIQGTWWTKNTGRPMGRRDQIQDDPEQFCKLSITLAWDADVDSSADWGLSGDSQWVGKYPETETQLTLSKLDGLVQTLEEFLESQNDDRDDSASRGSAQEEGLQPSSSSPPHMAPVSHQEQLCQDLPKPRDNADAAQVPQVPPRLQEHELAEMGSQTTSTTDISSDTSSQSENEDPPSRPGARSCLNFGWAFRWLRQQVFSALLGREDPGKATESPHRLAQTKRLSHRSKRVQPQEPLGPGHPVSPEFFTF